MQPSKNPFLDTLKAVVIDIRFFLFLLLLTVWGFACAFFILFRNDQSKHVRMPRLPRGTCRSDCPDQPHTHHVFSTSAASFLQRQL